MIYLFNRIKYRKKDGEPTIFETMGGLFFLFMSIGSIWEVFMLVIDPIFIHPGTYYFYYANLLPTGFSGEASVYFLGFLGLGLLCIGIERGSNLQTKGFISLLPWSFTITLLLFGMDATNIPWFLLAFFSLMVPSLYFYIAVKGTGSIRTKALYSGFGFFWIFAGEAFNIRLWTRIDPVLVTYTIEVIIKFPVDFMLPLLSIIGCLLLINGQIKYKN